VVEAAERSGSLITAGMALDLGRSVGAVPGPVNSWMSTGANQLLVDGAVPIRDAQDVLDHLLGAGSPNVRELGPELDPSLRAILEHVEVGHATCDAVALASDGPAHLAATALTRLELLGYLASDHTGRYSRTPLVARSTAGPDYPPLIGSRITYALLVRLPVTGVDKFEEYERIVLPLLDEHGGRLERRLRSPDKLTEIHVVGFESREAFAGYREDPLRTEQAHLLAESGAEIELLEVDDV
jgi:hypothetical protein